MHYQTLDSRNSVRGMKVISIIPVTELMPTMNGLAFIEKLRQLSDSTVIILSDYDEQLVLLELHTPFQARSVLLTEMDYSHATYSQLTDREMEIKRFAIGAIVPSNEGYRSQSCSLV